jgi:hypothetical protein
MAPDGSNRGGSRWAPSGVGAHTVRQRHTKLRPSVACADFLHRGSSQICTPIPRLRGSTLHAETQSACQIAASQRVIIETALTLSICGRSRCWARATGVWDGSRAQNCGWPASTLSLVRSVMPQHQLHRVASRLSRGRPATRIVSFNRTGYGQLRKSGACVDGRNPGTNGMPFPWVGS